MTESSDGTPLVHVSLKVGGLRTPYSNAIVSVAYLYVLTAGVLTASAADHLLALNLAQQGKLSTAGGRPGGRRVPCAVAYTPYRSAPPPPYTCYSTIV
eukprot:gene10235-biopygen2894